MNEEALCGNARSEKGFAYKSENGKSCPDEILEVLKDLNAEGRPIWKPMHMQPIYRMNRFITRGGNGRAETNAYIDSGAVGKGGEPKDIGMDIFSRGCVYPVTLK